MKRLHRSAGFTLTEVMVASALSALVTAAVLAMVVNSFKNWRTASACMELSLQGRILRERVLYGVQGQFGLRHAGRHSLLYTTNALQFQDSESTNRFTVMLQTNQAFRVQNASGSTVFAAPSSLWVQSSSFTLTSNTLVLNLVLARQEGSTVWSQPQEIRTYLSNE